MISKSRNNVVRTIVTTLMLLSIPWVSAYEVAVGLGSTADQSATAAMGDRSQWPYVADNSWGPLANLVPIAFLPRSQQEAVFNNFKQRRAITELPFPSIRFESSQPDIDFIESFGLSVPYVFVLYEFHERVQHQGQLVADALKAQGVIDSMLTRSEILQLKSRFPNKKIIMNTRSWVRNSAHLQTVTDVLDGVCIEYIPNNTPGNIALHVAPFAEWAHNNDKILMFLMPPLPDDHLEDRFVRVVTRMAQTIYDENVNKLPKGWMSNENLIFVPANYTFGASNLDYVPEDAESSVLAAAKALLLMRPELDAGPAQPTQPEQNNSFIAPLLLLLE